MTQPTVTCIVTAYNVGPFLDAALTSALALEWPQDRLQVVAVDDGSTDETPEILARYADRIEVVRQENAGFIAAVNAGLARATGTYIGLLDGDDEWPADRLLRQVEALERHPAVGLVHGDMELIDASGRTVAPSFFAAENVRVSEGDVFGPVLRGNFVSGGASLFRASLLDRIFPIPPAAAWPDWWFATRIAEVMEVRTVAGSCNRYRQHGANMGLGADPRRFAQRKVEEIRFRRWILQELGHSRASVADLLACFGALEIHAAQIGSIESRSMSGTVEPSESEEARAEERFAAGLEQQQAGELEPAARSFLQALGWNPWHGRARAEAHFAAQLLGDRAHRAGPLPRPVTAEPRPAGLEVSIVIPTFNKLELTRQCLEAIRATAGGIEHEVIVVDNASTDGTPDFLRAEHAAGRLRAVLNEENLGFGKACNLGVAASAGRLVLLLNNDTIPHPGWLEALVRTLDDPSIGMVGARLLYADGTIQHAGVTFRTPWLTDHVYRGYPGDHPDVLVSQDYPAVTGACILMPRDLWEELDGLDEGYRHYVEDVDLCMRVWAAGRRVHYCADSVVTHLEQQSAPDRAWIDGLVEEGWRRFHSLWSTRWPEQVKALSPVVLPEGTRPFAVVALAGELVQAPELLRAYAEHFGEDDEATLVVFDPDLSPEELASALGPALEQAGLTESGPDMLALGGPSVATEALAGAAHGLLARREPFGALSRLPRFGDTDVAELRTRAERFWATVAAA